MSKPTLFTPALATKIVKCVLAGDDVAEAAAMAGIGRSTLYDWLKLGEAEKPPEGHAHLVAFALRYRKAEATYARRMRRHSLADAKAAPTVLSLLKCRFPDRYGQRQVIEHQGSDERPVRHVVDVTSDDLLLALDAFASGLATAHDGPSDAGGVPRDADPGAEGEPRG